VWGEPDLEHAAELMQQVAARRLSIVADPEVAALGPSRDPAILAAYRQRFKFESAVIGFTGSRLLWPRPTRQTQCPDGVRRHRKLNQRFAS
jgi:hypothetical protein